MPQTRPQRVAKCHKSCGYVKSVESEKRNQVLDDVTKSTLTSLDIKEEKIDLKPTIKGNTFLGYDFCFYST